MIPFFLFIIANLEFTEIILHYHDEIYLNEYSSIMDLKSKVKKYIYFYNHNRFHSALDYKKPMNVYLEGVKKVA
jgi:putative transposase